jgi:hypothetical protein
LAKAQQGPSPQKYKVYESFLVEYYEGSERVRRRRSSLAKASALVDSLKIKFLNGKTDALQLEGRDQHIYLSALEQLKEFNLPVDQAIAEYVKAAHLLRPHGLTVVGMAHEVDSLKRRLGGAVVHHRRFL